MGLYVNGQVNHEGALHSFSVQNFASIGNVVNQHAGWEFVLGNQEKSQGVEFGFRGKRYDLSKVPGLVFNAREDHHEFYNRPDKSLSALVIGEDFIDSHLGNLDSAGNFSFREPLMSDKQTYHFIHSAYRLFRSGDLTKTESTALAEALVFETIDSLSHDRAPFMPGFASVQTNKFLFKDIVGELHRNLANSEFDLDHVSSELGVTKFHIIRTTKRIGGFTPYAYLLKIRLLHAKELLINTRESISDIATKCGFDELSTFNKAFKRIFRTTPSSFHQKKGSFP